MKKTLSALSLLLLMAAGANAQTTELEIGFRWTDIGGNELMYRSQVNEQQGFLLRSFTMLGGTEGGALDSYRIDAFDIGNSPYGALRVEGGREGAYRLRMNYRTADAFNSLATFANPLLAQGVIAGQHTKDRTRTSLDTDLEFIPGRKFSPFVGYTFNRIDGPGQTTYHVGQDEFRMLSELRDTDQEFRGGFTFQTPRFSGQVTQGWREFRGSETLTLAAGAGSGNNLTPILGTPVTATSLTSFSKTNVSTPFTNAYVVGQVTSGVRVIANFVRFAAETDGSGGDDVTGTLVSFPLSRYFAGLSEQVGSSANNETWRGEGRVEIELFDGVDLLTGFRREHRELDGASLISSVLIESVTFAGADRRDLTTILSTQNALTRDENVISATLSARALGPFAIRAGYSESDQELTITPDISEVVIDGGNAGTFDRKIRTFDTTGTFAKKGLTVGLTYRADRADEPIFRTDFTDRDRLRLRATYLGFGRKVRLGATAERTEQTNDATGIGFDGSAQQFGGDVEYMPFDKLRFRAGASQFKADSSVLVRRPENFGMEQSVYAEEGLGYEGGVTVLLSKFSVDADVARFENEGTIPFTIDRYRARLVYDFAVRVGIAAEIARDEYQESLTTIADFDATRYGLYLRLRR